MVLSKRYLGLIGHNSKVSSARVLARLVFFWLGSARLAARVLNFILGSARPGSWTHGSWRLAARKNPARVTPSTYSIVQLSGPSWEVVLRVVILQVLFPPTYSFSTQKVESFVPDVALPCTESTHNVANTSFFGNILFNEDTTAIFWKHFTIS